LGQGFLVTVEWITLALHYKKITQKLLEVYGIFSIARDPQDASPLGRAFLGSVEWITLYCKKIMQKTDMVNYVNLFVHFCTISRRICTNFISKFVCIVYIIMFLNICF
jgi:hypothetical protein